MMKRFLRIFLSLLVICFVIGGVSFSYLAWFSHETAGSPIELSVPEHATRSVVARLLQEKGLIPFSTAYRLYALADQRADQVKAGTYTLRKGASFQHIADVLARGPVRAERSVRLVEGKMIDENIAALVASGFDAKPYEKLTGRSMNAKGFDDSLKADYPIVQHIPSGQSLEGYVFPDTYTIYEDDIASLVRKQLNRFESVVQTEEHEAQRKKSNMSWHEVLTLASIVQDEVRRKDEMKTIAGIFLNRLHADMPLQSDATINYILRKGTTRPSYADLSTDSPYNTYAHPGLPPGPIGNPGLDAIQAVLDPTPSDYYYFLTDEAGKVYVAKTYEEHLANKRNVLGN